MAACSTRTGVAVLLSALGGLSGPVFVAEKHKAPWQPAPRTLAELERQFADPARR